MISNKNNELKIIKHNGQVLETKFYKYISDEMCEEIRKEYYTKPDIKKVENNIKKIYNGGKLLTNITNYYFKDLMAKTKLYHSKWSIEEVFECNDLIRHFYAKTLENDKVYPPKNTLIKNIETALRLGGKGVASKPSNFPINYVDVVLKKYNVNDNYYDFSCGWGVRMLGALRNNINYFGTDPNYLLTNRLKELYENFKKINNIKVNADIRTQGSQYFIEEWEGKIGVAFSSPPYFGLEDYKIGDQSYKNGITYNEWKIEYLDKTIKNIYRYLIPNGYLIININNYKNFDLVGDTKEICLKNKFKFIETLHLENIKRSNSKGGLNDNSEGMFVFQKIN